MAAESKTPIVVAVITVVGVIVTATFANWDKLVGKKKPDEKAVVTDAQPTASASQAASGNGNVQIVGSGNTVTVAPPQPKPVACRDESHGVERYARTFETDKNSSWLGGGFDQAKWCTQVISELRGQHPQGNFTVVSSSEKSESKCAPLNCPQYMYYCKVKVETEPVYDEKLTSACR
jgi:hypothetical protein